MACRPAESSACGLFVASIGLKKKADHRVNIPFIRLWLSDLLYQQKASTYRQRVQYEFEKFMDSIPVKSLQTVRSWSAFWVRYLQLTTADIAS